MWFWLLRRDHPIAPVMLFDARLASAFADEMLKRGIYVIGFSFPVSAVWHAYTSLLLKKRSALDVQQLFFQLLLCACANCASCPLYICRALDCSVVVCARCLCVWNAQVVPKGQARIRVQLSASHTTEQVNRAADAFIAVGKQLKVIPWSANYTEGDVCTQMNW
jgi:hypothetical protein